MKKIFALILFVFLGACARQPTQPDVGANDEIASKNWQTYLAIGENSTSLPQRISFSLRFGSSGDTRRVTALLWGNARPGDDNKVRLDVMAGVGAVIACVLDTEDDFLVYAPREGKAYGHEGHNKPLLKVGVPVPFNLQQLFNLLCGRPALAFGHGKNEGLSLKNGSAQYQLSGAPGGTLTIDQSGRPILWQENEKKGWKMEIAYPDEGQALPEKLRLDHPSGKKAIILVKEREQPAKPFSEGQMALKIPPGTQIQPLSRFVPK